jgi:maleylpyruvate isomerase
VIVPQDLASDPVVTIALCQAAHSRLLTRVQGVTDEQVRRPSRLSGWTVAHVLTHVARNADGHTGRLDAALRGENLPRYPGGSTQRNSDIDGGATRAAAEIVDDLRASQARLDQAWERSITAGWPHSELLGSDHWPTMASPSRRLREVEMHHVDLDLGYEPSDWPDEYVDWELPLILATVPGRVQGETDRRQLVAWLSGRGPLPGAVQLDPWS